MFISMESCRHFLETYRELVSWPDLCDIERIEAQQVWIGILRLHDLHLCSPLKLLTILNTLPELALGVVWILARDLDSFWC
jgi:hypothetical protein